MGAGNLSITLSRVLRVCNTPPPFHPTYIYIYVKACEYRWGAPIRNHPLLARGGFDVVICSDLLYDPVGWEPLLASLRQLVAGGARGGGRGAGATTPKVYLAHRTRNAQERGFFAMLREGGRGSADSRASEGGEEEEEKEEGWSWSWLCRRRSAGGHEQEHQHQQEPQQQREEREGGEMYVGGRSGGGEKEVDGSGGGSCSPSWSSSVEGGRGLLWRRGCFPDVALYELSQIRTGSGTTTTHTAEPESPVDGVMRTGGEAAAPAMATSDR